jgi:hypothetical protein
MVWVYSIVSCPCIKFWRWKTSVTLMVVSKFDTFLSKLLEDRVNSSVNSSHVACEGSVSSLIPNKIIVNPSKVALVTDVVGDVSLLVALNVGALVFLAVFALMVMYKTSVGALVVLSVDVFSSFGLKARRTSLLPLS